MGNARNLANLKPTSAGLIGSSNLVNAGAELGIRNRFINGGFQISQRGTVTASATAAYGPDRWLGMVSGGTGISATFGISNLAATSTSRGGFLTGSWTTGVPYFAQRIESNNVIDLNNKQVTVSGKLFHDLGVSQGFVVRLSKATLPDNWTGSVVIATSTNIVVPHGLQTPFSVTFSVGGSDATHGLMVEIYAASAITVTSKSVAIADMQFEAGSVATPFEMRSIGMELLLCQRYWQNLFAGSGTALGSGAIARVTWPMFTHMRVAPSIAAVGSPVFFQGSGNATHSSVGVNYSTSTLLQVDMSVTGGTATAGLASMQVGNVSGYYTASAEL